MDPSVRSSGVNMPPLPPVPGTTPPPQQSASMGAHQVSPSPTQLPPPKMQASPTPAAKFAPATFNPFVSTPTTTLQSVTVTSTKPTVPPLKASPEALKLLAPAAATPVKGHELMSNADLLQQMGRPPKKDGKLFGIVGPRVWPRSETYRNVMAAAQSYNTALRAPAARDPATLGQQAQQLKTQLQALDTAIDARLAKKNDVPMQTLKAQVTRELAVLDKVAGGAQLLQVAGGAQLPQVAGFSTLEQLTDLAAKGLPLKALKDLATYSDGNLDPTVAPKQLGAGKMNVVTEIRYQNGETMVFKPLNATPGPLAKQMAISPDDTRFANRNVAVSLLAESMGLDVIPKTRFAMHNGQLGIVMEKAPGKAPNDPGTDRLALDATLRTNLDSDQTKAASAKRGADDPLRTRLEGDLVGVDSTSGTYYVKTKHAEKLDSINPQLMQKMCDLEWFDWLTTGGDRNPNNYLIHTDANGKVSVKGIDNDYALAEGGRANDPSDPLTMSMPGGPRLISRNCELAFRKLAADWDKSGGPKDQQQGVSTQGQIDALKARLDKIIAHIDQLAKDGRVVDNFATFTDKGQTAHQILTDSSDQWAPKTYVMNLDGETQKARQIRKDYG
jgi:hypothetical protein